MPPPVAGLPEARRQSSWLVSPAIFMGDKLLEDQPASCAGLLPCHPGIWALTGQRARRGKLVGFKVETRLFAVIRPCKTVSISFWAPRLQRGHSGWTATLRDMGLLSPDTGWQRPGLRLEAQWWGALGLELIWRTWPFVPSLHISPTHLHVEVAMFLPHVSFTSSPLRALQGHGRQTEGSGGGEGLEAPQPALPAGAGQDVGRSCILVSIAGKNVMLDCGMHMGFNDDVSPQTHLWGWGGPVTRTKGLRVLGSDP